MSYGNISETPQSWFVFHSVPATKMRILIGVVYINIRDTNARKLLNEYKFTDLFYSIYIYGSYNHPSSKPFIEESHNTIEGWSLSKKENRQITKRKEQNKKTLLILMASTQSWKFFQGRFQGFQGRVLYFFKVEVRVYPCLAWTRERTRTTRGRPLGVM